MQILKVSEFISRFCVTAEQGDKVFAAIEPTLLAGENVTLDFSGVTGLTALFLGNAIGRLLEHFDRNQLDQVLSFENADEWQAQVIEVTLRHAAAYHRDPKARAIFDAVSARTLDEMEG